MGEKLYVRSYYYDGNYIKWFYMYVFSVYMLVLVKINV